MKQFTLTLITKEPRSIERIESNDLLSLLSQFQLLVGVVAIRHTEHRELMKRIKETDDEIPF